MITVHYPKDKIEKIRNTYYTPPLDKLFPNGQDGSGNTDTNTPTVPDNQNKKNDNKTSSTTVNPELQGPNSLNTASPDAAMGAASSASLSSDQLSLNSFLAAKGGNDGTNSGNGNSGDQNGKGPKDKNNGDTSGTDTTEPQIFPTEPDYLLQPSATVQYTYDAVGNRLTQTDDYGTTSYKYDAADRLLSTSNETFKYDRNGNMVERNTKDGLVQYSYTPENQLEQVSYPDETYVKYQYDAFDRKVYREEQYYDLNGPGESMGHGKGYGRDNNPGQGNGYGKSNNPTPGSNGNGGAGNGKDKGNSGNNGNGHAYGRNDGISNYQLKKEDTRYLYDASNQLLNEYTGSGDPLAQYYYANGEVVARKMFGFKDRKDQGYLGNLRDRGHLLFYHYDQGGNVTDLTDHLGSEVVKYRYDAFGGFLTNAWSPYNYTGLTGKSYDPKASLMDYSARWYSPNVGRFTSRDSWTGDTTLPQTLNRYAYTLNNPVKYSDPSGHMPCYEDADGTLYCGYSKNPDDWGAVSGGDGGYTSLPGNGTGNDYDPMLDPAYRAQQLLLNAGVAPEIVSMILEALSMGLDMIPVVGNIKMFIETVTGYDLVTGQKLSTWDRALRGMAAVVPGLAVGEKLLSKGISKGIDIELKYKEGWTAAQRAEADEKVKALTEANTVKTAPKRSGTSASSRYKKANGSDSVPQGKDVDHTIDLQLGGADDILNMNPLDSSVNRSLGKQIQNKIKDYPDGTVFDNFTITD